MPISMTRIQKLLPELKKLGLFRLGDARKLRISHPTIYRLVAAGKLVKVTNGFYLHSDADIDHAVVDFAVACKRLGPKSAIGGISALFHYGLIDQVPQRIWLVVPQSKFSRVKLYRCLRTKTSLKTEIIDHGLYRMTSLERTLLEALKYSSKIGLRTALGAIRKALKENQTTLTKIGKAAQNLKMQKMLERYWEAIVE